ncbi:hypothetical protein BDZ45DRAFT_764667 [Acephala macrosclerotiorum]|nr:hypothetical protein BDZ45DRAFT_764667 [Acephala macrosclerotiorum]
MALCDYSSRNSRLSNGSTRRPWSRRVFSLSEPLRQVTVASDLHKLAHHHLKITNLIYGHDIGCMIAHAYAFTFPEHTLDIIWGMPTSWF